MAFPENSGSDAHDGCTFLYGDLEIVAHTHGEVPLSEATRLFPFERIPHPPEFLEEWPRSFRIREIRRYRHQAIQLNSMEFADRRQKTGELVALDSELGLFFTQVNLKKNGDWLVAGETGLVKPHGQLDAIEGMDHIEKLRRPVCLV
jgi:hypothetical protein